MSVVAGFMENAQLGLRRIRKPYLSIYPIRLATMSLKNAGEGSSPVEVQINLRPRDPQLILFPACLSVIIEAAHVSPVLDARLEDGRCVNDL